LERRKGKQVVKSEHQMKVEALEDKIKDKKE